MDDAFSGDEERSLSRGERQGWWQAAVSERSAPGPCLSLGCCCSGGPGRAAGGLLTWAL